MTIKEANRREESDKDRPQRPTRIEIKPPYTHVAQKLSLCGSTCLEMILRRRGVKGKDVDQEQLALALGTTIPEHIPGHYSLELPVAEDPLKASTDLSAFVGEPIKDVFRRFNLKLETKIYYIDAIGDLGQFLENNLRQGNDILVNYIDVLGKSKGGAGHYALVSGKEGKAATLCDPWEGNDNFYDVSIDDLAKQIDTIDPLGNRRGIVIFKEPARITKLHHFWFAHIGRIFL